MPVSGGYVRIACGMPAAVLPLPARLLLADRRAVRCFDPPARACPTGRTASDGTWEGRATVCTLAGSIRVQAAQLLVLASDEPEKARRGKTDALLP